MVDAKKERHEDREGMTAKDVAEKDAQEYEEPESGPLRTRGAGGEPSYDEEPTVTDDDLTT